MSVYIHHSIEPPEGFRSDPPETLTGGLDQSINVKGALGANFSTLEQQRQPECERLLSYLQEKHFGLGQQFKMLKTGVCSIKL